MSAAVVLRYERLSGWHEPPGRLPQVGEYLTGYDPDAHDGRGAASFDNRPDHALRFPDAETAAALVEQPSTVRPTIDGQPNRPLTAFVLMVVRDPLGRAAHEPEPEGTGPEGTDA